MHRSHPLPRIWLMTDERFGDDLMYAIQRLPFKSGVIFRHYATEESARRRLFRQILRICRKRGHVLLLAGDARQARTWHADGHHQRSPRHGKLIHSAAVHNAAEIASMKAHAPDLLFVSPLYATNSHATQRPLGPLAFCQLVKTVRNGNIIALGGMNRQKARLMSRHIHGWAAIDAFKK
nr:thiamine phosphate synthase [uncultured Sphingorhabdus sp.]